MSSHIPFDTNKALEWNAHWEKRFGPNYERRSYDGKLVPIGARPAARRPDEPHSASVIRELERHINGKVLSP